MQEISGEEIKIVERQAVKNSSLKVKMISTTKNFHKIEKKVKGATLDGMRYDDVKQYVEENRIELLGQKRLVMIAILTAQGWKCNDPVMSDSKNLKWVSRSKDYEEKYDIQTIYAFQIVFLD